MMWQHLVLLLLFLTGIPLITPDNPRKYYLIQQTKTWNDAQTFCQINHDGLVTIKSPEEMIQLKTEAQQFSANAWIGLYRQYHDWCWSLGNESLGGLLTSWCGGEPDNHNEIEECVALKSGCWTDEKCTSSQPFLCFDDRKTGTDRYIVYNNGLTWYDAQNYCRLHHTDLASVRDATESLAVTSLAVSSYWIGLRKTSWIWSDQTNTPTIMWASGAPTAVGSSSYCGYLYNGQITDSICTDLKEFFCYSATTGQKQIIRVKVQSDQDGNDLTVMALILEQIRVQLRERGVENISVKWREQPDEKVFHKLN